MMIALVSGEIGGDFEPYLKILKEEPQIQGDFSVFVKDLILFALKNGESRSIFRIPIRKADGCIRNRAVVSEKETDKTTSSPSDHCRRL